MAGNLRSWGRRCLLWVALILALLVGSSQSAFSSTDSGGEEVLDLLAGKTAGVVTGTPQDQIVKGKIQNAKLLYFNSSADLALALQKGKIDFFVLSDINYYNMAGEYPEFGYLDEALMTYDLGFIFPKTDKGGALCSEINEYIQKLKENGQLESLEEYWLYPKDWKTIDIPKKGEKGILHMATPSTQKPFSFILNDKNVGLDMAIAAGFCQEYGYGMRIENSEFAGVLSGIAAGKYDLAAGQIAWTQERAQSVLYSASYYQQKIVAIVRAGDYKSSRLVVAKEEGGENSGSQEGQNGTDSRTQSKTLWDSIRRTLLDENRWLMLAQGLLVTLLITLLGFLLANLLGILFCAMAMSRSRLLHTLAGIYSGFMQGLPPLVILMLLYYVIFGKSQVSNVLISILGFGLVFGAYMAQLFRGSIEGVDGGQREAGLATGLTKGQTFRGIVLPQAVRSMLPGYFSNLISLMKGTAIVGYIAVADLTKAGDIIRSSTYEAFVPLIVVAFLYFLFAGLFLWLMNRVRKWLLTRRIWKDLGEKKKENKQGVLS